MDKRLSYILLWLFSLPVFAQEVTPNGYFLKDSIKIGEELPYVLWVRYPKEKDVVFPDSLYDFSPFELDRREYFTTKSDSVNSLDSTVYYLSTFEIDTVQYLRLPVFFINEFDSTTLFTTLDSVVLQQVVTTLPDSVAVKVNTQYNKVPLAFNYPYFTVGIIILIILIVVVYLIFGKKIRNAIRILWIKRRHKQFIKSFDSLLEADPIAVEQTLSRWKKYMERLLGHPYTKLTSKEIVSLAGNEEIEDSLRIIDRYIYGGEQEVDTSSAFEALLLHSIDQYHRKIKEINHG